MQGSAIDPPEIQQKLWDGFSRCRLGFDVGANVGQSVVHMLDVCEEVICFEPAVESFEVLKDAYWGEPKVDLMRAALSDVTGSILLVDAPAKIATGQLVSAEAAPDWGGEGDWDLTGAGYRSVLSYTVDDFAALCGKPPSFMKIDVEGHELKVLQGASKILERGVEMLIEVHSEELGWQIWDLLNDTYRIETVRHPHYADGSLLWKTHFWYRCFPQA